MSQGDQQAGVTEDSGRIAGNDMGAGNASEGGAAVSQFGAEQTIDPDAAAGVVVIESAGLDGDDQLDDDELDDDVIVDGVVVSDEEGDAGVFSGDETGAAGDAGYGTSVAGAGEGTLAAGADPAAGRQGRGQGPETAQAGSADSPDPAAMPAESFEAAPGSSTPADNSAAASGSSMPADSSALSSDYSAGGLAGPSGQQDVAPTAGDTAAPTAAARDISQRWREIQAMFVDDPRGAVELAAAAANDAVSSLVSVIQQRQESLHRAGDQGSGGDTTEQLRSALQDYRALFQSLEDFAGQLSAPAGSASR